MGIPQETMGSTSRRNLQAVLAYVNYDYPMESLLLLALATPHGGMKTALSVESGQYVQAVQWVQQVAKELPWEQHSEKVSKTDADHSLDTHLETPVKVAALPEQFRQALPKTERLNPQEPKKQENFDPFDPDLFNEQYHRGNVLRRDR
jgi:hypothetical protein